MTLVRSVPLDLPTAINNLGTVVGRFGEQWPAYVPLGSSEPIPIFKDDSAGDALAINDQGAIVGLGLVGGLGNPIAWSFRPGSGLVAHAVGGIATSINNAGTIVGVDDNSGFVVDPADGKLAVVRPAGTSLVSLLDINNQGRHVGLLVTANGARRGTVGRGAMLTELDGLLLDANVQVDTALAINDSGWIAALGFVSGEFHGLLLKPVVAPGRFEVLATVLRLLEGGVLGDSGVGVRLPGGGREPIPPGPLLRELSDHQRDTLIGLAVAELAELFSDRGTRAGVRAIALERVRATLEQTLGPGPATTPNDRPDFDFGPGFPPIRRR